MALKNVYYQVISNNGKTFIQLGADASVYTNSMHTIDCVGPSFLGVKFYDTSTISIAREFSYDGSDWASLCQPGPINDVLAAPTWYTVIVSAITTTNAWINLVTINSATLVNNPNYLAAPYTRFQISSHKSVAKVDLHYFQMEEEGGY